MSTPSHRSKTVLSATKAIPALFGSRLHEDSEMAMIVLDTYFKEAKDEGINRSSAWQALFSAALGWAYEAAQQVALLQDESVSDVIFRMGAVMIELENNASDTA